MQTDITMIRTLRNGEACCESTDPGHLCADCRRGLMPSAGAWRAYLAQALRATATEGASVPPPPDLIAAVQANASKPPTVVPFEPRAVTATAAAHNYASAPPPPDFITLIKEKHR